MTVNNQAPELSPEARRIINEARGVDDPTAEDQARVKARWLASVAAVAGVSSLTEAARAAGGIGWGLKAAGAALVLAAGAIGLYVAVPPGRSGETIQADAPPWTGTTHGRFEKTPSGQHTISAKVPSERTPPRGEAPAGEAPAVEAASAAAPATPVISPAQLAPGGAAPAAGPFPPGTSQPIEGASLETDAESAIAAAENAAPSAAEAPAARKGVTRAARRERVAPRATPRSRIAEAPVAPAPVSQTREVSGQLGEELALISEIRGSVQKGAPARALELLRSYEARFARPILGMEADALRVDALCKSGEREAARASARAFQNDWPGSPLERRVSAACP